MAIGPGTLLMGRYQVGEEPLAVGGMGKVWPGRDRTFDRDVAIKVMLNPDQTNVDLLERFRLEARVAANLEHPRFTVVHDFGDLEGELFIVMERLRGQDLRALIQLNPQ